MLAAVTTSIVNTSAYTVVIPRFAIIVWSVWLAIVIALHIVVLVSSKRKHHDLPT